MKKYIPYFLIFVSLLSLLLTSSCTTHYVYSGILEKKPDSDGEKKDHLIFWTQTDKFLWFGTSYSPIILCGECSLNRVHFSETEEGIIFRKRESDQSTTGKKIAINGECGRILTAKKMSELKGGDIELLVNCKPAQKDEFEVGSRAYLQSKEEPYTINIKVNQIDDIEKDIPKCPCSNSSK